VDSSTLAATFPCSSFQCSLLVVSRRGAVAPLQMGPLPETSCGLEQLASSTSSPREWAAKVVADAKEERPFSEAELDAAVDSLRALNPTGVDWVKLRSLYARVAHLSHKDWHRTDAAATELRALLGGGPDDAAFRALFSRVLRDGMWDEAAARADQMHDTKPWVVLIAGCNGIRKSSSVYQTWFREAVSAAINGSSSPTRKFAVEELPDGRNSFFRQLDFIVSTVSNDHLKRLYEIEDMGEYAAFKDSIYVRYRTVSEILGVVLAKEAMKRNMNIMVETSGRNIAMFEYVDHFFDSDKYNKLVVHFTINDVSFAEWSVEKRMRGEMKAGKAALSSGSATALVDANSGGPYGPEVLRAVQAESDQIWEKISTDSKWAHWRKAGISIHACDGEWTASARTGVAGPFCFGLPR
jgi:hypothetical protein